MNKEDKTKLTDVLKALDADFLTANKDKVCETLLKLLKAEGSSPVAWDGDSFLQDLKISEALEKSGIDLIDPPGKKSGKTEIKKWRSKLAKAETGITSALALSMETGSVLLPAGNPDTRMVSLLPEHHVIILHENQIVEDISALIKTWEKQGDTNQSAIMVTGPSRTADIEKELVLGVHGPGKLTVIMVTGKLDK